MDAARARLAIIGPRAVEHLLEALEGDDNRIRARVMPLLALIQDPRGRAPLTAMLLDRSSRLREIAARCLGRFPDPTTVAALQRVLERDRSERVKVSAVRSLVEQYEAGQDPALCQLLEILTDASGATPLRLAAIFLLPHLRPSVRRGILERLAADPDAEIRQSALSIDEGTGPGAAGDIKDGLVALASSDYAKWNVAVGRLAARGVAAIEPLLTEMQGRAHDPEFCKRAGMALRAMGPRRARAMADALESVEEPLPLQVLIEVIGTLGDKSQIYRLKDVVDRLALHPTHPADVNGWDPMQRVRAKAHLELARIGSRVAIADLRDALADPERRIELEMLTAVKWIGKRDELVVLLSAYGREDPFTKEHIVDVVRAIRTRERIRRNDKILRSLNDDQLSALKEILPVPAPRRTRRNPALASRSQLPGA